MTSPNHDVGFHPTALVAACIFPGAGHMARGEVKRGTCIAAGLLGLFLGGLLIGGIDVIDSREDGEWYIGQAFLGPLVFGTNYLHQNHFKVVDVDPATNRPRLRSANPDEGRNPNTRAPIKGGTPPNSKSIGKMNELGTLYVGIAGMLNIIVILDAGFPTIRPRLRSLGLKPTSLAPSLAPSPAPSAAPRSDIRHPTSDIAPALPRPSP